MKLTYLLLPMLVLALSGCASTPKSSSLFDEHQQQYKTDLQVPAVTEQLNLVENKVFDEPELGAMLRYEDKLFPADVITVYVYPIFKTSWDDIDATLNESIFGALQDINQMVKLGNYLSATDAELSDFTVNTEKRSYQGKKVTFTLTKNDNVKYYSNIYVFIDEDKYIKFRTSFDSRTSRVWSGDSIVNELLPLITVPKASKYMHDLRQQHANGSN